MIIPFNKPLVLGSELGFIQKSIQNRKFSKGGEFLKKSSSLLKEMIGCRKVLLTSSCTGAMEIALQILGLENGDEVIMPAFEHCSIANALDSSRLKITWCDITKETKNIDESQIEKLISEKTKAIIAVHYAGIPCEVGKISHICRKNNLFLIEDAAQSIGSKFNQKPAGSFGDLAITSFHETKNIHCGEGGALIINNSDFIEKAEMVYHKGTNRKAFDHNLTENWSWQSSGKHFMMSELQAAFLFGQLMELEKIYSNRLQSWNHYHQLLSEFLPREMLPFVPENVSQNAHLFYLILDNPEQRTQMIDYLNSKGIQTVFHYLPLHRSPFWKRKYKNINLPVTEKTADTILRLPMFYDLKNDEIKYVVENIKVFRSR
ncbi:MAG: dTDP-4-amino-4,6-dideoxygalactose transaminase [Candidatus Cloacimonetes bacterium]|nr:dTDP-4-amino-4,6-dideoxygalactose transaminase [Candidatus Cloacimonadota bacterium]